MRTTAIFSLLDQALLRSLPVKDPEQLVVLEGTGKAWQGGTSSYGGDVESYFSYPMYRDLRDRSRVFDGLAATSSVRVNVSRRGTPNVESGEIVSGNYFQMLGVRPALGRLFTGSDDTAPGANQTIVLSYEFWRNRFGADRTIIGDTLSLDNHPVTVIGVAAPEFRSAVWGQTPSVFMPMSMLAQLVPGKGTRLTDHTVRWLNIVGRLRVGLPMTVAEGQIAPLWYGLRASELAGTWAPLATLHK